MQVVRIEDYLDPYRIPGITDDTPAFQAAVDALFPHSTLWRENQVQQQYPTPTVGRKVYFYDAVEEGTKYQQAEPWDATIIKVHADNWYATPFSAVNLLVVDPNTGQSFFIEKVTMNPGPSGVPRFCWMDYQIQQETKAAAGESAASAVNVVLRHRLQACGQLGETATG